MPPNCPKPTCPRVVPEGIPDFLKTFERWVCWTYTWKENRSKWDKPPRHPDGGAASSTNRATWVTFDRALQAHLAGRFDGIGFVLGEDEESGTYFSGFDLDKWLVGEDLEAGAAYMVGRLNSYTEKSPSLKGLKVFCLGKIGGFGGKKDDKRGIEMYDSGRYFTMTGLHWRNTPTTVKERSKELTELREELFPQSPSGGKVNLDNRDLAILALKGLNLSRCDGYDSWLTVGMILHSVSPDLLDVWDEWSRNCPEKYNERCCDEKWRSFRKSGVGIGTLIYWAKEDGWTWPHSRAYGTGYGDDDHVGDGLTDEPGAGPWRLLIEKGSSPRYYLSSPIWCDRPMLKDGFVVLDEEEFFTWRLLRKVAMNQSGGYVRMDSTKEPVWDGHEGRQLLRQLMDEAEYLEVPAEFDKTLGAAEYILDRARTVTVYDDTKKGVAGARDLVKMPDGTILFKPRDVAAEAKRESIFTFDDIRAAAKKYGEECWPTFNEKRCRFHRFTAAQIGAIEEALGRNGQAKNGRAPH